MSLFGRPDRFEGGLREIAPSTYAWLQPNGALGESNAGLVVGEGESLLVDTLWDVRLTRLMLAAMDKVTGRAPVRTVVNTHSDGDHWWGNQLVRSARIVTSERSKAIQDGQSTGELTSFELLGGALRLAGRSPLPFPRRGIARALGRFVGEGFAPYDWSDVELTPAGESFTGELSMDLGGREVRLIEVGPAHTPGDLIVHVPREHVVFAADVMFLGVTPIMWAGPLANWLAALDTIERLEPAVVVPGHGPVTDLHGVDEVRGYWSYVEPELRERYEAGMKWGEAAEDVVTDPAFQASRYARWDNPERIAVNAKTLFKHWEGKASGMPGPRETIEAFAAVAQLRDLLPPTA